MRKNKVILLTVPILLIATSVFLVGCGRNYNQENDVTTPVEAASLSNSIEVPVATRPENTFASDDYFDEYEECNLIHHGYTGRINGSRVNLQVEPSFESEIVMFLYDQQEVLLLTSVYGNNWVRVSMNGIYGYLYINYVTADASNYFGADILDAPVGTMARVNAGRYRVDLRERPTTCLSSSRVLATLNDQQEVLLLNIDSGWGHVFVEDFGDCGIYGYLLLYFLSIDERNVLLENLGTTPPRHNTYRVGEDIPAGVFIAINDGSIVSSITVRNVSEEEPERPRILMTARFLPNQGRFAARDAYVTSTRQGGGIPILPGDSPELSRLIRGGLTDDIIERAEWLAENFDGLMLTGGGDVASHFFNQEHHPASAVPDERLDAAELALARAFARADKPILGICRGMQLLNIALGGDLIQDIPCLLGVPDRVHRGDRHFVDVVPDSWLYELIDVNRVITNSFHHQALGRIAPGFSVAGTTGPVIEAFERGNILGTQFHPELMLGEGMLPVFTDFIERASLNNVMVNIFSTITIFVVQEGQYLDVMNANIVNIEHTSEITRTMFEAYGYFGEGMYRVGFHLPPGEYKLIAVGEPLSSFSAPLSFFSVFSDTLLTPARTENITHDNPIFITLEEGEYIRLIGAKMIPDGKTRKYQLYNGNLGCAGSVHHDSCR